MESGPPSRSNNKAKPVVLWTLVSLLVCAAAYKGYQRYSPMPDDVGKLWSGLDSSSLDRDLQRFREYVDEGGAVPPILTKSIESVWQYEGNLFYTRSYSGFDAEVICKVKDEDKLPFATKYGVVVWSKHIADDYWWMVLRS